ncbi:geranylgeranyl pyrophosphate synthetase [Colletotrichum asianum]|uniref:Geranylgeranyl pyrophosphate synthetase n=1 Tax=Colletotrichum asianum TaxID=702518 RepID=A0A8H3WTL7_9PEZI|nr:geranylgeranyl pyrophosphate synthetase [Colletotrichum asianum]
MARGGARKRKREQERERRLQQQPIFDNGGGDKDDDGDRNEDKGDGEEGKISCDHKASGSDDGEHPAKRFKVQDGADFDISQKSATERDAPSSKVAEKKLSIATDPSGAKINEKDIWLYWNTVQRAGSLDLHSIQNTAFQPISCASGFDVVTSYNWLNEDTILVPGGAPAMIDPQLPLQIERDNGTFHIDINASMNPPMPFEPMFRAIAASASPPMFNSIDVVVNRNSLRQLFEFVKGSKKDTFKVQLNMVGNTLFITRREKKNQFRIDLNSNSNRRNMYSFGHSFEDAFTEYAPDTKGSLSHHRAIRYQFGDLNVVVRHEVDAAQQSTSTAATASEVPATTESSGVNGDDTSWMIDTRKSEAGVNREFHKGARRSQIRETKVQRAGVGNPPSDLVELKARRKLKLHEVIDQIWFGRTPHLINGIHKEGKFSQLKHTHCEPLFKEWEDEHQTNLAKLAQVIAVLRQEVRAVEGRRLVAICRQENPSVLEFWTPRFTHAPLPDDMIERFLAKQWGKEAQAQYTFHELFWQFIIG